MNLPPFKMTACEGLLKNHYACRHGAGTAPCAICQTEETKMNSDELQKDAEEEAPKICSKTGGHTEIYPSKEFCGCSSCKAIAEGLLDFHSKHQEDYEKLRLAGRTINLESQDRIKDLSSKLQAAEKQVLDLSDFHRKHNFYVKENEDLRFKLKHQDERVKSLEEELAGIRKRFDERCYTPNEHEKFLLTDPLQKKITALEARVKELETEIKDRQDTEQSLTNWVHEDGVKIKSLEAKLAEKEKEISMLRKIHNLCNEEPSPATLGIMSVEEILNIICSRISSCNRDIKTWEYDLAQALHTALLKKVGV